MIALSADTEKQQRLAWHLAKAGLPAGWRAWINEQRRLGISAQAIGYQIFALTHMQVDQSTVNLWIKQAERETPAAAGKAPPTDALTIERAEATQHDE